MNTASPVRNDIDRLSTLPSELIQHIARFCPPSTILSLLLVNKTLHTTILDAPLLKHTIQFYYPDSSIQPCPPSTLLSRITAQEALRLAFAIEQTTKLDSFLAQSKNNTRSQDQKLIDRVASWFPYLVVVGHPNCYNEKWLPLFLCWAQEYFPLGMRKVTGSALTVDGDGIWFCIVANMLQNWGTMDTKSGRCWLENVGYAWMYFNGVIEAQGRFFRIKRHFGREMRGLEMGGVVAVVAGSLVFTTKDEFVDLPLPTKIPFASIYADLDFMRMFEGGNGDGFGGRHLGFMTTPGFLGDGEWIGCYSRGVHVTPNHPLYLEAMSGVRFEAKEPDEDDMGDRKSIVTSTTGSDQSGMEFGFKGEVFADGNVKLRKEHQSGERTRTDWLGKMTPFGIFGVWGVCELEEEQEVYGYFWMWKKDWVRTEEERKKAEEIEFERAFGYWN